MSDFVEDWGIESSDDESWDRESRGCGRRCLCKECKKERLWKKKQLEIEAEEWRIKWEAEQKEKYKNRKLPSPSFWFVNVDEVELYMERDELDR